MKITLDQLKPSLTNQLAPIYIISGDEILLKEEAIKLIKEVAEAQGFTASEKFYDQVSISWETFVNSAKTLSLSGEKTIIELSLDKKPNKEATQILETYADKPSKDKLLLVILPKLDATLAKSKWLKALEAKGVLVKIWPLDIKNLPFWTLQRLQQLGLNTSLDVAKLIADKNANNLLAINQEIEKLQLAFANNPSPRLTIENVANLVSNNAKFSVFDWADFALAGNRKQVVTALQTLKNEGAEPILLLWTLVRDLKTLLKIASLCKTNSDNLANILEQENVFYKRKPLLTKAIKRLSVIKLQTLLKKAAKIDRTIKGAEAGNVWLELLSLSLKMGG